MVTNAHHRPADREWIHNRKFEPSLRYAEDMIQGSIEVRNYDEDWVYVACDDDRPCSSCSCVAPHTDSIVIAVDGACRGNGTPSARAAIGVFVSETSKFNQSVLLSESHVTNQIAELRAGILALEQVMEIVRAKALGKEPLHTVVIKADSEYLVKGMTEWVFKWESKGYRNAKGGPVKNDQLFKKLHALIENLNTSRVEVLFWQVPRGQNQDADKLANQAF
ncbi:uncharacterized protein FIESC28_03107 [Fusarium coffeatum]|uniref:ribonuclease H n=1 Tax=Fusarium coffeatum TaxID=231269 RepID=A0A366S5F3_9HYPO|nr:uncharacterized protein FIESC28_03107 [Fusarium coffeatum]RBR24108.1 hypothetical protein FIESC28_03107 [Fusarium coffeatum]